MYRHSAPYLVHTIETLAKHCFFPIYLVYIYITARETFECPFQFKRLCGTMIRAPGVGINLNRKRTFLHRYRMCPLPAYAGL